MNKFEVLQKLGAGDFQHLNGSLESHLKGTAQLLKAWECDEELQVSGLFHAAYGTAGFDESMVSLAQREEIAHVIGEAEEALVYLYCSCDRSFVFPQFGKVDNIEFKDRFNGEVFTLTDSQVKKFCELTVANELELIYASDEFKAKYGSKLLKLFQGMDRYLNQAAREAYKSALCDVVHR